MRKRKSKSKYPTVTLSELKKRSDWTDLFFFSDDEPDEGSWIGFGRDSGITEAIRDEIFCNKNDVFAYTSKDVGDLMPDCDVLEDWLEDHLSGSINCDGSIVDSLLYDLEKLRTFWTAFCKIQTKQVSDKIIGMVIYDEED